MLHVKRMVHLAVTTGDSDDHDQTYQDLSELARNLVVNHEYVTVTSSIINEDDEDDDEENCSLEHLYYDDQTLMKVRRVMIEHGVTPDSVDDLINDLMNVGIVFRERVVG